MSSIPCRNCSVFFGLGRHANLLVWFESFDKQTLLVIDDTIAAIGWVVIPLPSVLILYT